MANNDETRLDISGIKILWNKLKSFFVTKNEIADFVTGEDVKYEIANADYVSKSNSSDVFGSSANVNGDYMPGLVPLWSPAISSDTFLKSNGTWVSPFVIEAGKVEIPNSTSGSISRTVNCYLKKKYIKIYNENGELVMSSLVNGTSVTPVCTKIGSVGNATDTSFHIFIGAPNSGSTFYWECYGER